MNVSFGDYLEQQIRKKFTSVRSFVIAAHGSDRTAGRLSYLFKIIKNERPALIEELDIWAKTLKLGNFEIKEFRILAGLSHIPSAIRPEIAKYVWESHKNKNRPR